MAEQSWVAYLWFHKDKLQLVIFIVLFLVSLRRAAGAPERILAAMLLAIPVVDHIYHLAAAGSLLWRQADIGHLVIDGAALGGMFFVALHANRVYPLWIAAAQIIATSGHLYRMGLTEINRFAYDVMAIMPSYIQILAMTLGLACHLSRRRKRGSYPSWRRSSFLTRGAAAKTLHAA
ncbi:hypothetical protein [Novosphingobium sp. Leaf2]|uniref:hypothetical protein n=1 Tax=Novosphingobium sp. Leaf2 TaxID=1735670 RepID=UPI0006F80191|nr:hypothetical protein [Novosphingobium sp. Leaf2]KQM17434.1 hypothetical protein ASE49_10275 [Novosphingobium sp. Leaf2]